MAGCAVPPHQQVREGVDPEHIDTDVRFRATYYFRVFDFCPPEKRDYVATGSGIRNGSSSQRAADDDMFSPGDSKLLILTDSLYRFRMTGKANALTTTIHFESGTLRASEIDPFGSNVEFDQENQRFYRVSHRETKQRAITAGELKRITSARETADRELVKLLERRAAAQASDPNGQLGVALDGLIQKKIATVDALADREHGLLLTESPLRASPSVSLPKFGNTAAALEKSSAAMAEHLEHSPQKTELQDPFSVDPAQATKAGELSAKLLSALAELLSNAQDRRTKIEAAHKSVTGAAKLAAGFAGGLGQSCLTVRQRA